MGRVTIRRTIYGMENYANQIIYFSQLGTSVAGAWRCVSGAVDGALRTVSRRNSRLDEIVS